MSLWGALIIGMLGSLHCVGMCGPIALALPGKGRKGWSYTLGRVGYNAGRILSYAMLGGVVAMLGAAAAMFELQRYFSLALGIGFLLLAARELWIRSHRRQARSNRFMQWLTRNMSVFMRDGSPRALLAAGILNGLLPCGLVYVALFNATLSETPAEGALKMALFGLGTFPVMFVISFSGKYITATFRQRINYLMPFMILIMGCLFFVRGLALGIPYLSPSLVMEEETEELQPTCCSHKVEGKKETAQVKKMEEKDLGTSAPIEAGEGVAEGEAQP